MSRAETTIVATTLLLLPVLGAGQRARAQPYPPSPVITGVQFYPATFEHDKAPGSDNWPITWADDDNQYTSWGDGGGFGGTNQVGRVSLGVARVSGPHSGYSGHNIWGGYNSDVPATFGGKSYGIISIAGILYMWVAPGSGKDNFISQTLYHSSDHARSWTSAGWSFTQAQGVVLPTFLQFGKDYAGARDEYVYIYAIRLKDASDLVVQKPGQIDLFRVPKSQLLQRNAYQFFAGLDAGGQPTWTSDLSARRPVFEDARGVGWNVSVSYNAGIGRYLLCTEHDSSPHGNLGMFDAPEPWGPWTTVGYWSNWQGYSSTFFWNFSPKWRSADGTDFVLVFTGVGAFDDWNIISGTFTVTPLLEAPGNLTASAVSAGQIDLAWTDNSTDEEGFAIARRREDNPAGPPTVTLTAYAGSNTPPTIEAAGSANSFRTGALVVNDRADTWTRVPAELADSTRLLAARDDRQSQPLSAMYTVELSGPATVYLPLDPRYGGGKLSWMDAGWSDSGLTCDSSAQAGWKIWKKEIAAAGTITLGVDEQQYDGMCYVFTAPGAGPWQQVTSVAADTTAYSDSGLEPATTYSYRVRAYRGGVTSAWCQPATATTLPAGEPRADGGGDDGGGNGDSVDAGADAGADEGAGDSGADSGPAADDGQAGGDEGGGDAATADSGNNAGDEASAGGCGCAASSPRRGLWLLLVVCGLLLAGGRRRTNGQR